MSPSTLCWLDDKTPGVCIIPLPIPAHHKTNPISSIILFLYCIWTFGFFKSWLIRKDSSQMLTVSSRVQLHPEFNVFSCWDGARSSVPRLYKPPQTCRFSCKWPNTFKIATAWRHTRHLPSQFLSNSVVPLYEILAGNLRLIISALYAAALVPKLLSFCSFQDTCIENL